MSDIMNNVNLCHLSYGTDQGRDRGPVGEMLPQKAERLAAALSMASSYEPVPLLHISSLLLEAAGVQSWKSCHAMWSSSVMVIQQLILGQLLPCFQEQLPS